MILTVTHFFILSHYSVIEGETVSRLSDAKRRLDIIVWSNRLKEPISHFISIPLNHPIITERLNEFRSQVLASCSKVETILYLRFTTFKYSVDLYATFPLKLAKSVIATSLLNLKNA